MTYRKIIKPQEFGRLVYGVDYLEYIKNTSCIKLISIEPDTLVSTNNYILFRGNKEQIFKGKIRNLEKTLKNDKN